MAAANGLDVIAKVIRDLGDLVDLVQRALSKTLPWQRKLAGCLDDAARTIQVLRMTIAMERPDPEILAAAAEVHSACRRAELAVAGTRADVNIKASLRLAVQQSQGISALLQHVGSKVSEPS